MPSGVRGIKKLILEKIRAWIRYTSHYAQYLLKYTMNSEPNSVFKILSTSYLIFAMDDIDKPFGPTQKILANALRECLESM